MKEQGNQAHMASLTHLDQQATAGKVALVSRTPGPWRIGPYEGHVCSPDGRLVAACRGYSNNHDDLTMDTNDANARFIVRACNNFDSLLAALTMVFDNNAGILETLAVVRAAIAKAEGSE